MEKKTFMEKKKNSKSVKEKKNWLFATPWPIASQAPGNNTGVGSHSLLQGIIPIQGSDLGLLHCKQLL